MPLLDRIQEGINRVLPAKQDRGVPLTSGISSSGGVGSFDDNMIVSKPTIICHACQLFFVFLAFACFCGVAGFQAKWHVGPSGLTGFAIFVAIITMLLSLVLLLVPVIYEKYDKFPRLARSLREVRVSFVLTGLGAALTLLIALITVISAFTEPGCKDASLDPHAKEKGPDFTKGLPGWCSTKRAGSIFFWLGFIFWSASFAILLREKQTGGLKSFSRKPRDPPFTHPPSVHTADEEEDGPGDEESAYQQIPAPQFGDHFSSSFGNSNTSTSHPNTVPRPANYAPPANNYNANPPVSPVVDPRTPAQGRPSMDTYGAFSDPAPTGFGDRSPGGGYSGNSGVTEPPRISRTMQYADPYAAVRASITSSAANGPSPRSPIEPPPPPSYESYQGYR